MSSNSGEKQALLSRFKRRIVIFGFRGVGKTNIVGRQLYNKFIAAYNPTITNTYNGSIDLGKNHYELQIVDTAGLDEFSHIHEHYCLGVDGYILVYSITSRNSFEMVKIINEKILNTLAVDFVPRVLVGNKADLDRNRVVGSEEGLKLANSWDSAFMECSAKSNQNIHNVFETIIRQVEKSTNPGSDPKSSCCTIL